MAKYSTGSGGGGDGADACELCGREGSSLTRANVAGADLLVCSNCAPHGENRSQRRKKSEQEGGSRDDTETNRKKRAAQNTARVYDASRANTKRWEEEGTDYEEDRLPYLVDEYGDRAETARRDEGLTVEELADEIAVDEDDLHAVEEGRASRANVGGSVIGKLEERLGVELADE
ncbi:helix-turn-helix domain-containing protein [Halorarum halobium]|uniref:helix-turn-helix domain-containing protein n=1 Tax=Halorarum halobium TaxID=3075121 RepID=UPI0028A76ADE|nr:transcriptional regulator [Halobaculum sp. XH14]